MQFYLKLHRIIFFHCMRVLTNPLVVYIFFILSILTKFQVDLISIFISHIYINYFILFFYERENFRDQQLSFKTSNKWLPSTNMNQILKKNSPQTTKKPSFNIFTLSYWNSERERERERERENLVSDDWSFLLSMIVDK